MKLETLDKLFTDELKDLYSAEAQLLRALPKMAKAASSETLRTAFETHAEETEVQKQRLDKIGELCDIKLNGKKCVAMEGLIEEGKEILQADGPGPVIDAALIGAAQRVEHYEISAYGTARALAEQLGYADAVALLDETIMEEGETDHKLTKIAEQEIYPAVSRETSDGSNGSAGRTESKATAKAK